MEQLQPPSCNFGVLPPQNSTDFLQLNPLDSFNGKINLICRSHGGTEAM